MSIDGSQPGSWREEMPSLGALSPSGEAITEPFHFNTSEPEETKPQPNLGLVRDYRLIQESLGIQAGSVAYPCSAYDTSPSAAFPGAEIEYFDMDTKAVSGLQEAGFNARTADVTQFIPEQPFDTVILLNPAINPENPSLWVQDGGYIIANNYHSTADAIHAFHDFECVGVVTQDPKTNDAVVQTENLDAFFEEVTTDEEFQASPFSFRGARYNEVKELLQVLGRDTTHVVESFKALCAERKEQGGVEDFIMVSNGERRDKPLVVETQLPRKRGTADSLFVFKRTERPEWLQAWATGKEMVEFDGIQYQVTMVEQEMQPDLPGFVGFPKGEYLFMSQEVPPEFRPYVLRHEIREFATDIKDQPGRCVASLQAELAEVPEEMRPEYVAYRTQFFRNLIAYYDKLDQVDGAFVGEIKGSLNYLENL